MEMEPPPGVAQGLGRSSYFAFRGSKWYARPVTLRIQALI